MVLSAARLPQVSTPSPTSPPSPTPVCSHHLSLSPLTISIPPQPTPSQHHLPRHPWVIPREMKISSRIWTMPFCNRECHQHSTLKALSPIVPLVGGAVAPITVGHAQVTQSSGVRGKNVKQSFGTMSPDESNNSSTTPFPLLSLQAPISTATSSLPSSKRSCTGNSAQTGQPSQSVVLISVSNAIQHLNDQLDTNFVDSATKVAQAIPLIYADTVCPPVHTHFASQYLTLHPNAAVVYMSLPNADAWHQYLKDLFDESGKAGSTMD